MKCKKCDSLLNKQSNGKYLTYCSDKCKTEFRQKTSPGCESTVCNNATIKGSDGRWLKYCSSECRKQSQVKRKETWLKTLGVDHPSKATDFSDKYKITTLKNHGVNHHMQLESTKDARKEDSLEKYGVEHHLKSEKVKTKILKTLIKNGNILDRSLYGEFDFYYEKVWTLTNEQFRLHYYDINPLKMPRGKYTNHLDHIYSISAGLENKVPPEIISHWTNLRLIDYKSNISKNKRCDKTIERLYEDYNTEKELKIKA